MHCSVCGTSIIFTSPLPPSYVIKLHHDFTQYFKTFQILIFCVMQVNSVPTGYKNEGHDHNTHTSQLKYKTGICCSYKQATSGRGISECKEQSRSECCLQNSSDSGYLWQNHRQLWGKG
jgi:hypothetical protein